MYAYVVMMRWSDSLGYHDQTRVADAPLLGDERGALHRIIHGLDVWLLCARRRGSSGGGGSRSVSIFYHGWWCVWCQWKAGRRTLIWMASAYAAYVSGV